ncbi:MAG TPA: tetratricopeptide repeat protein [Agriterribacter sp.]|nr:tetratricopeptide repeat protein [Chitinophagaceae bacterium]HRP32990.1 tetratricopeptide repeat protein [Agriterribacter sp.]
MLAVSGFAQQSTDSLQASGRAYMRTGDWGNAIIMFNRALQQKPKDIGLRNDIAYTYFLQRDFAKALETIKPVIEEKDADVKSFQIAGTIYRAIEELKEGDRAYTKGIKKFPESGVLHSEYGELLWQKKDADAIIQWEKGIAVDPNYAGNYYHACRFYYFTTDKIWSLIYGELFVNLESYTMRTAEIKHILYDGYKKLFASPDLLDNYDKKKKNEFEKAFLSSMNSEVKQVASGINPQTLLAVRKGFLQNWFTHNAARFPFRLFEYQKQLTDAKMFDAYHEWIFGAAVSTEDYQQWKNKNPDAYQRFYDFQRGRVFKLPRRQYYQNP